jgi:hypothetical protein
MKFISAVTTNTRCQLRNTAPLRLQVVNPLRLAMENFERFQRARRDDRWHTNTVDEHADRKPKILNQFVATGNVTAATSKRF